MKPSREREEIRNAKVSRQDHVCWGQGEAKFSTGKANTKPVGEEARGVRGCPSI